MVRIKAMKKSADAKNLLYKTDNINELFNALAIEHGDPDDYVFPIYHKDKNEKQNLVFESVPQASELQHQPHVKEKEYQVSIETITTNGCDIPFQVKLENLSRRDSLFTQ